MATRTKPRTLQRALDRLKGTDPASAPVTPHSPVLVSSLKPTGLGQGAANATLKITGFGFASGATVSVAGNGVTVAAMTFVSATQLTAKVSVANGAPTGKRDLTVSNTGGSSDVAWVVSRSIWAR